MFGRKKKPTKQECRQFRNSIASASAAVLSTIFSSMSTFRLYKIFTSLSMFKTKILMFCLSVGCNYTTVDSRCHVPFLLLLFLLTASPVFASKLA